MCLTRWFRNTFFLGGTVGKRGEAGAPRGLTGGAGPPRELAGTGLAHPGRLMGLGWPTQARGHLACSALSSGFTRSQVRFPALTVHAGPRRGGEHSRVSNDPET